MHQLQGSGQVSAVTKNKNPLAAEEEAEDWAPGAELWMKQAFNPHEGKGQVRTEAWQEHRASGRAPKASKKL